MRLQPPLIPEAVARRKYGRVVAQLREVAPTRQDVWSISSTYFPLILIHVNDSEGEVRLALVLDLRNYDYQPFAATLTDPTITRFATHLDAPPSTSTFDKRPHLVWRQNPSRAWFCYPGFFEYHQLTPQDPWLLLRCKPSVSPPILVDLACASIDRQELSQDCDERKRSH